MREVGLLRAAQVVDERAGRADRRRVPIEAEPFEAAGVQLFEQRPARRLAIERPGVDAGDRQAGRRDRRPASGHLASGSGCVDDRESPGTMISRGRSTASSSASVCRPPAPAYSAAVNSPVDTSSSATPMPASARSPRRDRHQERRLPRIEIAGVGERAGRDDAHDFALDEAFGLARILDLIADGDAEALLHQAGDVGVDGVKRHAAHRNAAAVGVLGARGERQFERRARRARASS